MAKLSKTSVRYRPAIGTTKRCGTCAMYRAGRCSLVAGAINPRDVCDRWIPAGRARERRSTYSERWAEVRRREAAGRPMRHPRRYVFTGEE